jgi:hypothetical protein
MRTSILAVTMLLSGCGGGSSAPDLGPVGAGLSVIGLGIVIAALIRSIFRGGGDK